MVLRCLYFIPIVMKLKIKLHPTARRMFMFTLKFVLLFSLWPMRSFLNELKIMKFVPVPGPIRVLFFKLLIA